ncbi:metallophosphoesterase [Clostridium boliviensis]|uniref:Metallophosphoesterase n=1 Tax=Clostridium boliviensis TaxID=318465 RepID=A0ABU4GLM4_9CLOT|nr:metallophosphoesterase [Clostridium boliviensis]MDW2797848.1 metallophosphoesterase [Clostridium boliviensis]
MKKRVLLAALAAVICVSSGCSFKKELPESSQEESTVQPETAVTEAPASSAAEIPKTTEASIPEQPNEPEEETARIVIATDIHYLARDLTDMQKSYEYTADHGDGKVMKYIWEITDAFIEEVKAEKPDVVILEGDLTYNGERESHRELAGKLKLIEDSGIPVIVIPGNHDINNPEASRFEGESIVSTESITPDEFEEIYDEFGYNEAVSRDPASLSYIYQINDKTRALMLDSCQYDPQNLVGGMIKDDTYSWIEEQMEEAWNLGMNVIPVAHHNLLDESEVYLQDCTIEHSEQLIDQLESWEVPLFLSGHLHVQHYERSHDDSGIYEIVTGSLSTPPCLYGVLEYGEKGNFEYHTKSLDMKAWAEKTGNKDKNLLNFSDYGKKYLNKVFYNQAQDELKGLNSVQGLNEYQKDMMAKVYAELNCASYEGKVADIREKVMAKQGYKLWQNEGFPSILSQYLEWITADGARDYNSLSVK